MNRAGLLGFALSISLLAACGFEPDVGGLLAGQCTGEDSNPDVDISYMDVIRPMFDRPASEGGCGNSCHSPGGVGVMLSGFDMSSMPALRRGGQASGGKIVVPGKPCESVLLQKVGPAPATGARMPLSGPPFFDEDDLQKLSDWIAEGAKEN